MKLTKSEIESKREDLCRTLIQAAKIRAKADNIKKDLAEDFEKNEKLYRDGIKTAAGVIYRKPRWDVVAKENVEVDE